MSCEFVEYLCVFQISLNQIRMLLLSMYVETDRLLKKTKHANGEEEFIQVVVERLRTVLPLNIGMKFDEIWFAERGLAQSRCKRRRFNIVIHNTKQRWLTVAIKILISDEE